MSILTYRNTEIEQRESDGYVNGTAMCLANGRKIHDWFRTSSYKRYLAGLSRSEGIPANQLTIIKTTGSNESRGTWVHPKLAIKLGRWISVEFELWCDNHIKVLMKTGSTQLTSSYSELPQTYLDALKALVAAEEEKLSLQAANTELMQHNQIMAQSINTNAPKVAFANEIEFSQGSVSIGDYAKMIGTGRNRLFGKLRELKIIQQKPSNIPYQRFVDQGYFEVGETIIVHSNGEIEPKLYAKITGKGQTWLYRKLRHNQQIEMAAIAGIAGGVAQMTLI